MKMLLMMLLMMKKKKMMKEWILDQNFVQISLTVDVLVEVQQE